MFREDKVMKDAINYAFLVNYLKGRIENDEYLDKYELKRILIALEVEIKEKAQEKNERE